MTRTPHDLHRLVNLLDRAADGFLRELGTTHRRWQLLLVTSELVEPTQRDLAAGLGLSEAAVSRLVASAASDGQVAVASGGGRRRIVALTPAGADLMTRGLDCLTERFEALIEIAGVDESALGADVRKLLGALEETGAAG